jgi:hypothetical protein
VEDGRKRLVVRAANQEVVPHREHDVHIGPGSEPPDQGGDAALGLGRVQGEQLLELV